MRFFCIKDLLTGMYQPVKKFRMEIRKILSHFIKKFKKRLVSSTLTLPEGYYDIIGDIHGHLSELKNLLEKMEYSVQDGIWKHPERKAVFVGDFISRGPDSRGVMTLIRNMVENNTGYAILGNHELNAIGYFTLTKTGKSITQLALSNKKQMENIREQFKDEPELLSDYIKWLRRLPFFLNLGSIRVAHAYWNSKHVQTIEKSITEGKLTKKLIKEIFRSETDFSIAVKQTTRGIEINLPKNLIIKDEKNIRRTNFRIKWWESPHGKTFRELSYGNRFVLPNYTIPEQILYPYDVYEAGEPILFYGHYCINSGNLIARPNICCVDNCLAGFGRLAAYRWSGEENLTDANFVYQNRKLRS